MRYQQKNGITLRGPHLGAHTKYQRKPIDYLSCRADATTDCLHTRGFVIKKGSVIEHAVNKKTAGKTSPPLSIVPTPKKEQTT